MNRKEESVRSDNEEYENNVWRKRGKEWNEDI